MLSARQRAAAGGTAPYEWQLTGDLPDGVAFDPELAQLTGTIGEAGRFTFTVTATDATSAIASREYTLYVPSPGVPRIDDLRRGKLIIPANVDSSIRSGH